MNTLLLPRSIGIVVWLICHACCVSQVATAEIKPEFLMNVTPELKIPERVRDFNPRLKALWIKALERPEIDMQRMAAETLARGHEYGIPELTDAIPRLETILLSDSSHSTARFAAARALIAMNSRKSSAKLLESSQTYGVDLRQIVEPALAAWANPNAVATWNERLKSPNTRPQDLMLAIRGLGQTAEKSAFTALLSLVNDASRVPRVRLESAIAVGRIADSGLEQDAMRLSSQSMIEQLCALHLLNQHQSTEARSILLDLASNTEPAIASAALRQLNEIDCELTLPLAASAIQNSDPQVRHQGVTPFLELPTEDRITLLSPLLSDPHPALRRRVSHGLFGLFENEDLKAGILAAAMEELNDNDWRGQEQAALLLGAVAHKPAAQRLVDLLESPRAEVRVAAAWGLRKVAVSETIPAIIDKARRQTEFRKSAREPGLDQQVAHLFEALGILKAEEAMPLLLEYVPKDVSANNLSRGAAVWAIGRLYEEKRDAEVEEMLMDRLFDFAPQPLEIPLVKEMAVIGLARMQAVEHAPELKKFAETEDCGLGLKLALGWAVKELTGEELPPPEPLTIGQGSWFLEPLAD